MNGPYLFTLWAGEPVGEEVRRVEMGNNSMETDVSCPAGMVVS